MNRKEKIEIMKQKSSHRKKNIPGSANKEKSVQSHLKSEINQAELKACEDKINELQDKYLRLTAEFDNYRKRTLREKSELIKTASEEVLKKIIPVMDDFERGLSVVEKATDLEAVKQGMNLIYSRFKDFLSQNGVKEIEAMNQEFNTDMHEAVTKIPAPEEQLKGKVVDVVEKGYLLHDKVIRFPKVIVGE